MRGAIEVMEYFNEDAISTEEPLSTSCVSLAVARFLQEQKITYAVHDALTYSMREGQRSLSEKEYKEGTKGDVESTSKLLLLQRVAADIENVLKEKETISLAEIKSVMQNVDIDTSIQASSLGKIDLTLPFAEEGESFPVEAFHVEGDMEDIEDFASDREYINRFYAYLSKVYLIEHKFFQQEDIKSSMEWDIRIEQELSPEGVDQGLFTSFCRYIFYKTVYALLPEKYKRFAPEVMYEIELRALKDEAQYWFAQSLGFVEEGECDDEKLINERTGEIEPAPCEFVNFGKTYNAQGFNKEAFDAAFSGEEKRIEKYLYV